MTRDGTRLLRRLGAFWPFDVLVESRVLLSLPVSAEPVKGVTGNCCPFLRRGRKPTRSAAGFGDQGAEEILLPGLVLKPFGVPLDADHEAVGAALDGFDDAVVSNRRDGESPPQRVDGLVVPGVHAGMVLADDVAELAASEDADGVRRPIGMGVDIRQVINMLVQGAAQGDVELLVAAADAERRQVPLEHFAEGHEIALFPVLIHQLGLPVLSLMPAARIDVGPARKQDPVQTVQEAPDIGRVPEGRHHHRNSARPLHGADVVPVELVVRVAGVRDDLAVDSDERSLHEAPSFIRTTSMISWSLRRRSDRFAFSRIAATQVSVANWPCCSSQCRTLDFPLMGPIAMTCRRPKSEAGTLE